MINQWHSHIETAIINEYNKISPNLSDTLTDFTIDFGLILKDKSIQNIPFDSNIEYKNDDNINPIDQVWMIEINHFPPIAGTPLFDYKNEYDRDVLNGKTPFEFRYFKTDDNVEDKHLQTSFPHIIPFINALKMIDDDNQPSTNNDNNCKCIIL